MIKNEFEVGNYQISRLKTEKRTKMCVTWKLSGHKICPLALKFSLNLKSIRDKKEIEFQFRL